MYKIESLLEKGGMSILYLATHPETKEPITIKVLSPKFLSHPEVVNRFLREAEIIALTDHPNIVKLYGHGEWEGGLYIAMEFIQGISLRQYILQTPTTLKHALQIIIDIAYALCHLHIYGVIHRDLKPENILMTEAGVVKVIDFGIAQLLTEKGEGTNPSRQGFIGTPIYMSPEQRQNPESVTYASDIYSLGIIAYELILGKLSHGQLHLSLMPKGMQKILHKTLRPAPEERYQDVVDFIADVTAYSQSEELKDEKKVEDQISRTSEELRQAQMILMPSSPPKWPEIEIGLATNKGIGMIGIYYDFFKISEDSYGIIIGEPKVSKGAEGIIATAMLRGMARALYSLTISPVEMATILNDLLVKDSQGQLITMAYLTLNTKENTLQYLSCDYGFLLRLRDCKALQSLKDGVPSGGAAVEKIAAENPAIGANGQTTFHEAIEAWNPGDTLLLTSLSSIYNGENQENLLFTEKNFLSIVEENVGSPPQTSVDSILRKSKVLCAKSFQAHSATLIAVHRK